MTIFPDDNDDSFHGEDNDGIISFDASQLMRESCIEYYQQVFEILGFVSVNRPVRREVLHTYREQYAAGNAALVEKPLEVERELNYLAADCLAWVALPHEVRDSRPSAYAMQMTEELQPHIEKLRTISSRVDAAYLERLELGFDTQELREASRYFKTLEGSVRRLHGMMEQIVRRGNIVVFEEGHEKPSVIGRRVQEMRQGHLLGLHGMLSMNDEVLPMLERMAAAHLDSAEAARVTGGLRVINEALMEYAKGDPGHERQDERRLFDLLDASHALLGEHLKTLAALPQEEIRLEEHERGMASIMAELIGMNLSQYVKKYREDALGR